MLRRPLLHCHQTTRAAIRRRLTTSAAPNPAPTAVPPSDAAQVLTVASVFGGAILVGATYEGGITLYRRMSTDSVSHMRESDYKDRLVSAVAENAVYGAAFATVATLLAVNECTAMSVALVGGKLALDWLVDFPETLARFAVDWAVDRRIADAASKTAAEKK